MPNLDPIKDTAASRLASSLDNRASDDSGALLSQSPQSCSMLILIWHEHLMRIQHIVLTIRFQNLRAREESGQSVAKSTETALTVHPTPPHPNAAAPLLASMSF